MTFININDNTLNFNIEGNGFPVVLIHGFSDDLNYWNFLSNELKKHFTVITLDLRGHGKTPLGDKPITIELLGDDVYKLLEKLYIDKCHVIGFSLGGNVALELALNHPKTVKTLILISSYAQADDNLKECFKGFNKELKKSFKNYFDEIIPYILPEDLCESNKEEFEKIIETKEKTCKLDDLRQVLHAGKNFNRINELSKINCRTLIIASEDDELTLCDLSKKMHEQIPNSQLELLDYVKHNVFIGENIPKLNKLILEFLRNK